MLNVSRSLFSTMLKSLVSMLALSLVLTVSSLALGNDDVPELPAADGSSYTPEIMVKMVDGKEMKLSDLRGKVALLDFFWTKCPHCQEHAPHIVDLYKKYQSRGLVVLGLATDLQSTGDLKTATTEVKAFAKQYKLNYLVGFSSIELIAYFTDSHNRGVPQIVLFGTDGKMKLRKIGWSEQLGKEVETAINENLAKVSVAPQTAPASLPATAKPAGKNTAGKAKRAARV